MRADMEEATSSEPLDDPAATCDGRLVMGRGGS